MLNTCSWVMGGVFSPMPEKHTSPRRYICCDRGALRCVIRAMEARRVDQPPDEHNSFHDDNQFDQTCLRIVPLIELPETHEKLHGHVSAELRRTGPPSMHNGCNRRKIDPPTRGTQSKAEISLLRIHEERLIEATYSFECFATHRQCSPFYPGDYAVRSMRPGKQVMISQSRDIPDQPAQRRVPNECVERCGEWIA